MVRAAVQSVLDLTDLTEELISEEATLRLELFAQGAVAPAGRMAQVVVMENEVQCGVKMPQRGFGCGLGFFLALCPVALPKLLSNDLRRSTLLSMTCLVAGPGAALVRK